MGGQFGTSVRYRTLFIYWGRRGSISEFLLELSKIADDDALFSVSRQNELFEPISRSGGHILPVDTFERGFGAISNLFRLPKIRHELLAAIAKFRIDRVVVLMSHVWTPLLADSIRSAGARYVVVVHDAAIIRATPQHLSTAGFFVTRSRPMRWSRSVRPSGRR